MIIFTGHDLSIKRLIRTTFSCTYINSMGLIKSNILLYNTRMIVVYTSPGCSSCRKVKNYLKDNHLQFIEKNIFNTLLNKEEVKYLISRTENGTDDIISKRSKIIQEDQVDIESMSLSQLCDFIVENPSVLKRPIIIDDRNLQIGYDEEEIELFKKLKTISHCEGVCPHFETCGEIRKE